MGCCLPSLLGVLTIVLKVTCCPHVNMFCYHSPATTRTYPNPHPPTLKSKKPWACHPPTILIPTSPSLFQFSLIYWFMEQMEKIHCKELFQFFIQKCVQLTNVFNFWYQVSIDAFSCSFGQFLLSLFYVWLALSSTHSILK